MSENQQEWEISSIGEYCITSSGGTPNRSDPLAYGGDIPWVKSGEVASSDIWATEEHITPHGLNSSSAKIAEEGSILVAMYG
jgi:type I restriction enzyme, S subunit